MVIHDCVQCEIDQALCHVIHSHGCLWIVCMTARLDITPKTTEKNRIVRTDKSKAEVTNNKKTALEELYYWSWLLTDTKHMQGLFVTAELLVWYVVVRGAVWWKFADSRLHVRNKHNVLQLLVVRHFWVVIDTMVAWHLTIRARWYARFNG